MFIFGIKTSHIYLTGTVNYSVVLLNNVNDILCERKTIAEKVQRDPT